MSLYYVTGVSGSGKSTILEELKRRGYEAYDVDEVGPVTAKWHNDKTGYVHPKSSVGAAERTPEFLSVHSWKVSREEVEVLAKQAHTKTIFLGGAIANRADISDLFTAIFALKINNEVLRHRLASRANNDWGKSPEELQLSLNHNYQAHEEYKKSDHQVIDAGQPLHKVVDEILRYIDEN